MNTIELVKQSLPRRNRNQIILKGLGITAIFFAFLMLFILIYSLVSSGYKALTQTHIEFSVYVDPDVINPEKLPRGNFNRLLQDSLLVYHEGDISNAEKKQLARILSNGAQFELRDRVVANPSLIGSDITLVVPTSDPYDQLNKELIDRETEEIN